MDANGIYNNYTRPSLGCSAVHGMHLIVDMTFIAMHLQDIPSFHAQAHTYILDFKSHPNCYG